MKLQICRNIDVSLRVGSVPAGLCKAYCSKHVCWRSRQFGTSAEVSAIGLLRLNSGRSLTEN